MAIFQPTNEDGFVAFRNPKTNAQITGACRTDVRAYTGAKEIQYVDFMFLALSHLYIYFYDWECVININVNWTLREIYI